ncbi:hypothetical protein E0H80_09180 [Acinetobacter sp. ANC 4779]|uniref:hypothetical protein n=1 Tax=Acinetobacter sp. ANC 4779 TaxID=2529848 RepID=UPI00103A18B7|nr:hypothetical protein [Acinetobacter sp. ANC 4779]TCB50452.1 hypothetical protein E0H80_09180 [Acinetobacter sp. ANC 4779]
MKKKLLSGLIFAALNLSHYSYAMISLDDSELSKIDGQALLNLENSYDSSQGVNFHKLSIAALMELNVNIKTLQLGCGGVNNASKGPGCDIDISNLSLSGLNTGTNTNGSPTFNGEGRAATSASITNPFIEFAIKGNSAATREVAGFRLGAENIIGLLTLGTDNTQNPTDGIQSFTGYMKMAQTAGSSKTKAATFGDTQDQIIQGYLKALGNLRLFTSDPTDSGNTGITVPSMKVNFIMPETIVTGTRLSAATVSGIHSAIKSIPLAAAADGTSLPSDVIGTPNFANDQLHTTFDALLLGLGKEAYFKMGAGSSLDNLNLDITFVQALSMIHNIPLNGTGGYLSLQNQNIHWQGADTADIAKPGWWMSFKDPIQLGYLETTDEVDISYVLPQVAAAITASLTEKKADGTPKNVIDVDILSALGSLLDKPVVRKLNIDVGPFTSYANNTAAKLTLNDKLLKNQAVVSNCFGGHKFC